VDIKDLPIEWFYSLLVPWIRNFSWHQLSFSRTCRIYFIHFCYYFGIAASFIVFVCSSFYNNRNDVFISTDKTSGVCKGDYSSTVCCRLSLAPFSLTPTAHGISSDFFIIFAYQLFWFR
jgi:hypothetical protein